jgi:uroporphyrinogen decarboxylase
MTDRERFNNQMHYNPVDRCFNMEFGYWNENFETWEEFKKNDITNNAKADIFFNFDEMKVIGGNVWMSPPFEYGKVISESSDKKIIIDSDGVMAEVPKDGHDTIPHYIKSTIQTPDDWKRCKEERFSVDDPQRRVDIGKLKNMHPKDRTYPLGVDCGSMIGKIRDMLTFQGLAYATYDYPDMVEDMVEIACVLVEDFLDQILPNFEFDFAAGWEDICFNNGPIVSVRFFNEVVVPRYKRINKKLKEHNIDIWYIDCDGDVRPILKGFLEGGANCLFPYEVNSCAHPGDLLNEYDKELKIMGGVDKMKLIEGPSAIKEYLETLVPLVERGGFIPFCDHRCPPDVRYENYIYYLDLKEDMFGMH